MKRYLITGIFLITTSLQAGNNDIRLVKQMCASTMTTYRGNCPDKMFKAAIKKGCRKFVTYKRTNLSAGIIRGLYVEFGKSDPYSNKGEYYIFAGKLEQRLNRTSALFSGEQGGMYLVTDLPKGRYSEGQSYGGIVKGNGMYKYNTVGGSNKTVSIGKVISIVH